MRHDETRARWTRWAARAAGLMTAAVLAACGGGGGDSSGQGTLRVSMTDAPACGYDNVFVTVEKVRVHRSASAADGDAGWSEIVLSPPRRIDLLSLTNGVLEELGSMPLEAGRYQQVRLVLAENGGTTPLANAVKPTGGQEIALRTPSAQQSGLKMNVNFDVQANQLLELVIDFDACRSVVKAGNSGNYNLKPVVAVTPKLTTSISGYVTTTLTLSATTVSAQQNGVVVRATAPDSTGKFTLAFLPEGTYDVVVASEGRATAVVTGVPVTTANGLTTVTNVVSSISPGTSTMSEITGTASVTAGSVTTVVTDATVIAKQVLSGGPTVQVTGTAVDADLGTYGLRVPRAAPLKAPYAVTGPVFAADTGAAGKYRLEASAPGRTTVLTNVDVAGAPTLGVNFLFAP